MPQMHSNRCLDRRLIRFLNIDNDRQFLKCESRGVGKLKRRRSLYSIPCAFQISGSHEVQGVRATAIFAMRRLNTTVGGARPPLTLTLWITSLFGAFPNCIIDPTLASVEGSPNGWYSTRRTDPSGVGGTFFFGIWENSS